MSNSWIDAENYRRSMRQTLHLEGGRVGVPKPGFVQSTLVCVSLGKDIQERVFQPIQIALLGLGRKYDV